jgi:TATA-box binding protein (TBP) (component of TFIID and TFIIIB)
LKNLNIKPFAKMSTIKFSPSPLRVSTRVITANAGTTLNLKTLFNAVGSVLVPLWWPGEGILKMEHEKATIGLGLKDSFSKRRVSDKIFLNQSTLVVRKRIGVDRSKHTSYSDDSMIFKEVNVKLFANGGIQMTGIASSTFAENTLSWFIEECKKLPTTPFQSPPSIAKFAIQLVNSDFSVGAPLWRERIHNIFIKDYKLYSLFESTIYQGVNTKYYYNKQGDTSKPGQCCCKKSCRGQGTGDGDGECKRITLAIFQTGNIIITGARDMDQINEAHKFLISVLEKNADYVIRKVPVAALSAPSAPPVAALSAPSAPPVAPLSPV